MTARHVKACLITNPNSSHGVPNLSQPLAILRAHGWEVAVREKQHGGHATKLAHEAIKEGCNVVVDCAGDGTLNEVVAGVIGTDAAVGTLPGGTENLWAHEVGISTRLAVAATQLVGAERRRVDVGRLTVNSKHATYFILMAGVGFDGAVVERVNKRLKHRIGKFAVGLAGVEALPDFKVVPVRVEMDGIHWEGKVCQVVLGNTRKYGGFTQMTPGAFMDDGRLDVCLITAHGPMSTLRQAASLVLARHPSAASAETYRAAHVSLRSPVLLAAQVDGGSVDLDGEKPKGGGDVTYEFDVVAQGVSLLVPRAYDGALFQPARLADELDVKPLTPVTPPDELRTDQHAHNGRHGHAKAGGRKPKHAKQKQWRVQVLAIGASSFTAVRVKSGKMAELLVDPKSTLADAAGRERPLWGGLDVLSTGDQLDVWGYKGREPGTLIVERARLAAPTTAS